MAKKVQTGFTQLCVWPATGLGDSTPKDFEKFIAENFKGTRAKFSEVITTMPDIDGRGRNVPGTGGRTDLFFYVHEKDLDKFAVPRLAYGIRWWEDVLSNDDASIYPPEVRSRYPQTWGKEVPDDRYESDDDD